MKPVLQYRYNTFFLLEPAACTNPMTHVADYFLCLLQSTHIKIFNLQIVHIPLAYAVLLNLAELGQLGFHLVSKLPNLQRIIVIIRLYHAGNDIHQPFHPFPNRHEFFHVFLGHGIEIIVHMFQ